MDVQRCRCAAEMWEPPQTQEEEEVIPPVTECGRTGDWWSGNTPEAPEITGSIPVSPTISSVNECGY